MTSWRLSELAERLETRFVGDPGIRIEDVKPLDEAGPQDLSFLHNSKYREQAARSAAGAILVGEDHDLEGKALLVCDEPYLALARALRLIRPAVPPAPGVHRSAVVMPGVELGIDVSIGPNAVVGEGSSIGDHTVVGSACVLGRNVKVGSHTELHPNVVIEDGCIIGSRCIFQAGVIIGADGFGFATVDGVHHKVPQVGIVVVEDDVELGASVCVDRATLGETRVCQGVRVDNLVQIAHNVTVGQGSVLVSQVGIAGSANLGRYVVMGGQSGVAGHLSIGDGAQISAKTAVFKDVPAGETVSGNPARPRKEWTRSQAAVRRLTELRRRVAELEKRLQDQEVEK